MREICTAGSDRGARHKPLLAARPQASTDQVEALRCPRCAKEMLFVAAINDDGELRRLMKNLNLPADD